MDKAFFLFSKGIGFILGDSGWIRKDYLSFYYFYRIVINVFCNYRFSGIYQDIMAYMLMCFCKCYMNFK